MQGLEAGADDFLTKPVDDIALITRVKNLARLKTLNDEMLLRIATGARSALAERRRAGEGAVGRAAGASCWSRTTSASADAPASTALGKLHEVDVERRPAGGAAAAWLSRAYDLLIVSLNLANADGLRLCSQVRSLERTRHLPIIVLVEPGDEARLLRALDMGVNDYLMRPVDRNELLARVRTQIKRKRHSDHLRDRLRRASSSPSPTAHRPAQPPLHGDATCRRWSSRRASSGRAAVGAARRHRPLQVDQRHLRPRRRRRRAAGVRGPLPPQHARHRSRLPVRRRGVRRHHARHDLERACQVGERLRACIAAEPSRSTPDSADPR